MEPSSYSSAIASPPHRAAASFATQADALFRKNLTFQKRNLKTNVAIISFPVLLCVLLVVLQGVIDRELEKLKNSCGCACVNSGSGNGSCRRFCGIQYSTIDQVGFCPIPSPPRWPALLQVPRPEYRAARTPGSALATALPDESCRSNGSCPATVLITGQNRTLAQSLARHFFSEAASLDSLDYLDALSTVAPGTDAPTGHTQFIEPAFVSDRPLYIVKPQCRSYLIDTLAVEFANRTLQQDVKCVVGLSLWLDNPSEVNNELYQGYRQANADKKSNEFVAAFDFSNTNESVFNANIWYNSTYKNDTGYATVALVRIPRLVNMREVVEQLLLEPSSNHAIICDDLKKVYPGRDGSPQKLAVLGLSLSVPRGECFGMLGPNGAGKTSFINMMTGLLTPTSGTALVHGLDIRSNMDEINASMGVCPQHNLLWETLTGREHLLFYARLKNLKGAAVVKAVEESLKSVNLFHGGVADKQTRKYSGGMKRRLSVAISLIGDPKVVYMDEPSTGLDPASRNSLWNVVKDAKKDRAIILTTHSMEEAEVLCDRLGIFVSGALECIGNPKELKARYGGSYVFTMTTSSNEEEEVDVLVQRLSPSAKKIYHISGTQKYELPKHEVRIADVFRAVENAKKRFTIQAWGLADTTLEDVFIKVAKGAQLHDNILP